jgi:hypothetical protein
MLLDVLRGTHLVGLAFAALRLRTLPLVGQQCLRASVYVHESSLLAYLNKLLEPTPAFIYQVNLGMLSKRIFIMSKT